MAFSVFLLLGSLAAYADGVAQADSLDFPLDTTGTVPVVGGVSHASSADFKLDTTDTAPEVGGFATADSADFTLDTGVSGCAPASSGLVSWWPGAGNGNDVIGNNHGALFNGVAFPTGKVGQGYGFSGGSDYVAVLNDPSVNFDASESFTFETWVRIAGTPPEGYFAFLDKRGVGGVGYTWELHQPATPGQRYLAFTPTDGVNYPTVKTGPIPDGNFHHVAVTLDRVANKLKVYLDGLPQESVNIPGLGSLVNDYRLFLGRGTLDYPTSAQPFRGVVDELSLYSRVLSPTEIQSIHNAGSAGKCAPICSPAQSGLVGWWPGAGNGNDIAGANNGTPESAVIFVPGKVGQAFSFDASAASDVLITPTPSLKFNAAFTLEAWIKPTDVSNYRQIFSWLAVAPDQSYQLGLAPGGRLRMDISGNGTAYEFAESSNGALTADAWAHVAGTFSPGQMKLYVNGSQVASVASTINSIYTGTTYNMYIGTTPLGNQRFAGLIDEMSAYNRALSGAEILAIYNAGSAGKCLTAVYITSVNKSGASLNLSWLAQPGVTYRVQYKTDLNPTTLWTAVSGDVTSTGPTASKTDVVPASAPQRFYRVEMFR